MHYSLCYQVPVYTNVWKKEWLKKTPFGGLGPFSQKISEAPLGANDPVISPLPPFHIQPLRHYQPPAEFTEPPSLFMLASPLQLLQQMRRIFCQMYQSASCLSREEGATPGRGGKDAVGGAWKKAGRRRKILHCIRLQWERRVRERESSSGSILAVAQVDRSCLKRKIWRQQVCTEDSPQL